MESWLMTKHTGSAWWACTFPSMLSAVALRRSDYPSLLRGFLFFPSHHVLGWLTCYDTTMTMDWGFHIGAAVCILVDVRSDKLTPSTDYMSSKEELALEWIKTSESCLCSLAGTVRNTDHTVFTSSVDILSVCLAKCETFTINATSVFKDGSDYLIEFLLATIEFDCLLWSTITL